MLNLLALIGSGILTVVCWVVYLRMPARSPAGPGWRRLGLIPLYAVTLLLALRFGARTYPGIHIPSNETLNWLFNGSTLFSVGYWLTLLAAISDAGSVLGAGKPLSFRLGLRFVSVAAAVFSVAIASLGFWYAASLHRLPT